MRITEKDLRTQTGRTLDKLSSKLDVELDQVNSTLVKKKMKYVDIPLEEQWRIAPAIELLNVKDNNFSLPGFSQEEVETMLSFICTT